MSEEKREKKIFQSHRWRLFSLLPAWSGLLLLMLKPSAAAATLVVFEDGRHLRVESYEVVDDDRLTVGLVGGGSMTIPLDVVERIVDEEYERLAPAKPEVPSPAEASRSVRAFTESFSLPSSSPYSSHILEAARARNVDPAFIAAVIKVESNGYAHAVSRKGARGLMQLMPATARRLGVRSPFDPRDNIRGGVAYLAELAERFGEKNADLILAAYNAGEQAVEEYGGVPPYRETRDYVRRVLALWGSPAPSRSAL
ncbi:MAG: lytic transglycosylase domain-containing protein [Thermoanaerobaculia bacterium]